MLPYLDKTTFQVYSELYWLVFIIYNEYKVAYNSYATRRYLLITTLVIHCIGTSFNQTYIIPNISTLAPFYLNTTCIIANDSNPTKLSSYMV